MTDTPPPLARSLLRIAVRIAIIVAFAYGVHLLLNWLMDKSSTLSPSSKSLMLTSLIALMLLSYALLMAVPFVPGIEIGLSLIILRGPPIVPFVFSATLTGLTLAYLVGRYMPYSWLQRLLLDFRLVRASQLLERTKDLTPAQRIELLRDRLPAWLGKHMLRWRYVALAALINTPGNSLIGGGGGIALIAGLSRIFTPAATVLTFALAVAPFPIFVWFFGIDLFA